MRITPTSWQDYCKDFSKAPATEIVFKKEWLVLCFHNVSHLSFILTSESHPRDTVQFRDFSLGSAMRFVCVFSQSATGFVFLTVSFTANTYF